MGNTVFGETCNITLFVAEDRMKVGSVGHCGCCDGADVMLSSMCYVNWLHAAVDLFLSYLFLLVQLTLP